MMPSHSSKRGRKVRQDKMYLIAAVAVTLFLLIIVTAGAAGSKKGENKASDDANVSTKVITSKLEFEKKYVSYSSISKGCLVLVNDSYPLSPAAEGSDLVSIDEEKNDYYSIRSIGMKMNDLALKNFNSMMNGFCQEFSHRDIMITEAYVSSERQGIMHNQALENSKTVSGGGCSEHQTGLAVDLGVYPEGQKSYRYVPAGDYAWIKENCAKYGFIQRYSDDKAENTGITDHSEHFRYVGVPHAWYMTENDLSLEEYLQKLKKYAYGSKPLIVSCYDKNYEIYYIHADPDSESGNVDIYVPVNCQYTVSGNNADGFIVTVEK